MLQRECSPRRLRLLSLRKLRSLRQLRFRKHRFLRQLPFRKHRSPMWIRSRKYRSLQLHLYSRSSLCILSRCTRSLNLRRSRYTRSPISRFRRCIFRWMQTASPYPTRSPYMHSPACRVRPHISLLSITSRRPFLCHPHLRRIFRGQRQCLFSV